MKLYELTGSRGLIIVDVQPFYSKYIAFNISELAELMNLYRGPILMFVNAELTGDTKEDILYWWMDHGLDSDLFDTITFIDKGYGFLRSWMDAGIDDSTIITALRYMFSKRVWDSRDIEPEEWQRVIGEEWDDWMETDPLFVPPFEITMLKQHSPAYLCGGGVNECMREVQLVMNAFNFRYRVVSKFTYGAC